MGVLNCPPVRVALLSASMSGGGQPRVQANLARALAVSGHRVDFLFFRSPGPFPGQVPAAAGIVDLRTEQGWRQLWIFLIKNPCSLVLLLWHVLVTPRLLTRPYAGGSRMWMMQRLMALVRYLRHRRPAVIFPAGDRANLLALYARRIAGGETRIIVCQHNAMSEHLRVNAERVGKWRARLALALMCGAFRRSDGIVGISQGISEETSRTCRIPRERITTIYNPVVTGEMQALALAPLAHPWVQPGAPPVVLGVGRLEEQKDFRTLIRAFARVRRQRSARLVILGEGTLRGELAALAAALEVAEDVALPGFARNPFAWMSRASVFVLSSKWEGLAMVLVEALACGCPVVSTDGPANPAEVLRPEGEVEVGTLVPVGDDAALAAAIVATLEDPPLRGPLVERGRWFSSERAAECYERLIPVANAPNASTDSPHRCTINLRTWARFSTTLDRRRS